MKEKYEKIKEKKVTTQLPDLCRGFPEETQTFITYAKELRFEDRPDYSYLKKLIRQMAERENIVFDFDFNWVNKKNEEKAKEEKKVDEAK